MAVCVYSSGVIGIEATTIHIETRICPGLQYVIVGLPDEAVKESLFRIESAIGSAGLQMPRKKIVISMAPAGLKKQGAVFDLPLALSILSESGQLDAEKLGGFVFAGELSLNGVLRPVKGALSMAIQARKEGFKGIILPVENAAEAAIVGDFNVYGLSELSGVIDFLNGVLQVAPAKHQTRELFARLNGTHDLDFADVKGQPLIKRALEITAAGGHNALLIGPPGSGKTMLARRLPGIMPPMNLQEALDATRIHSAAGLLEAEGLLTGRPFRAPHHTASDIALVGGGIQPQPGEISLAHQGILFLDELPEFKRKVLEVLRQPLEERQITISRASFTASFPASFILVAAMNPCPCGFFLNPHRTCVCTPLAIRNYIARISGPLLDRIDLHIRVQSVTVKDFSSQVQEESSLVIRERVKSARAIQESRSCGTGVHCNAQLNTAMMKEHCALGLLEQDLLLKAMEQHHLSARSYDRILKVARTIADLEGCDRIGITHLSEAIKFRCLDHDYLAH